nr:RHS repeat-associated core domain-containing protein [Vibrio sinus]
MSELSDVFIEAADAVIQSHRAREVTLKPGERLISKAPEPKVFEPKSAKLEGKATEHTSEPGKTKTGEPSEPNAKCSTAGEPVSTFSGEELLSFIDYQLSGPIDFRWQRTYRTASSQSDSSQGYGWSSPLDESLTVRDDRLHYSDAEGRTIELPIPWQSVTRNTREGVSAYRTELDEQPAIAVTLPSGLMQLFTLHGERWRAQRLQDSLGNALSYHYREGRLIRLEGSWGRGIALTWYGSKVASIAPIHLMVEDGEASWQTLPAVMQYQYDGQGDLIATRNRLGHGEDYGYAHHLITKRTLASGYQFHFEWDGQDEHARCLRSYGDNGHYDYRFEWEPEHHRCHATDGRGLTTTYVHNDSGQLITTIFPDGATEHRGYDEHGQLTTLTDADGHTTHTCFDEQGNLLRQTDALGRTTHIGYDDNGNPTELTDSEGHQSRRHFDDHGLLTHAQDAQGHITQYQYNELGYPTQITAPDGTQQRLLWNQYGDLVAESLPTGGWQRYCYDMEGRITHIQQADGRANQYQYDELGRPTRIQLADGGTQQLQWDASDRLLSVTDQDRRTTSYEYADGLAQITKRIDAEGNALHYRYDAERNLIGLTNEQGEHYHFEYDEQERLIQEVGFDGRIQAYEYSPAGQLLVAHQKFAQQGPGAITRFKRDALGQLLEKHLPDGAREHFAYDHQGQLTLAENDDAKVEFLYGANGELLSESQNGYTLTHQYDAMGNRIATNTPDGQHIEYGYGKGSQLTETRLNGQRISQHGYDALGRETQRRQGQLLSQYRYDAQSRLTSHKAIKHNTLTIGREYGYYANGALRSIRDARHGLSQFFYDRADRLTHVSGPVVEHFVYDPAGNLLSDGQHHPGTTEVKQNRLLGYGHTRYDYDAFGSLLSEHSPNTTVRYQYDGKQQLVRMARNGKQVHFQYDALGRRIAKRSEKGDTQFIWDGDVLLQERQGERSKLYLHEPNTFRPLAQVVEGQVYHYQLDHIGTPRELTDSDGNIVWSVQYRAYGSVVCKHVDSIENNLRFQGQYYDDETGLHYNRHRYYNPKLGRYLSQDPLGLEGGNNAYLYGVNPINWVDPLGLKCKEDNKYFRDSIEYKAPDSGTGITYKVHQQEIDPDLFIPRRGKTNREIMTSNGAPYVYKNGKFSQLHLHHSRQNARGPLFELSDKAHRARTSRGGEALHPYKTKRGRALNGPGFGPKKSQHPNYPVDRKPFDIDRKNYWSDRINKIEKIMEQKNDK